MTAPPAPRLRIAVRCRVAVDNDWAGDPDGLVALAHHLLSPANVVTVVTSSFLNPMFGPSEGTAEAGAALARELLTVVGSADPPAVHAGGDGPFDPDRTAVSPAAEALIAEARRDDPLPLYLVCAGPLTNVAEALRRAPDIAGRFVLVWVGGTVDPAAFEYNRDTDPAAASFVSGTPGLDIRQFPLETYRRCGYSAAELEMEMGTAGPVGAWLRNRFLSLPLPDFVELGEVWPLGDSPPVLVTALDDRSSQFTDTAATDAHGPRRLYTDVDVRLLHGDLVAKLRRHALNER